MAAGLATLREMERPGAYEQLSETSRSLARGVERAAEAAGVPVQAAAIGGMWGFFLTPTAVTDYATAKTADTAMFARLFHALLHEGVYIAPSQFEACFTSTAHDTDAIELTIDAFGRAFESARNGGDA
jgi:glutamate-1-semialdehyde 2,1-aminomutase